MLLEDLGYLMKITVQGMEYLSTSYWVCLALEFSKQQKLSIVIALSYSS